MYIYRTFDITHVGIGNTVWRIRVHRWQRCSWSPKDRQSVILVRILWQAAMAKITFTFTAKSSNCKFINTARRVLSSMAYVNRRATRLLLLIPRYRRQFTGNLIEAWRTTNMSHYLKCPSSRMMYGTSYQQTLSTGL